MSRSSAQTSATRARPYAQARATDGRLRGRSGARRRPVVASPDDVIEVRLPDHPPELNAHGCRLLLAMLVELGIVGVADVDREDRADVFEH